MNADINELIHLFEKSLKEEAIPSHFEIIGFGGNSVVLRPLRKRLAIYCIKTVYDNYLKGIVLEMNREKVSDIYYEYLKDSLGYSKNFKEEIDNYRKLSAVPSLNMHIPELYYTGSNGEQYIIIEHIEGSYFCIEGLLEGSDEELQTLINSFNDAGFEFGDKIEGIKKHDGSTILIDLDSIKFK